MPSGDKNVELLQGTLDLIILRALATMGPLHARRPKPHARLPRTNNRGAMHVSPS